MNQQRVDVPTESAKGGIIRRFAMSALPFVVAVALWMVAGPEAASAVPVGAGEASCIYKGQEYSHGAVVIMDDGLTYICNNGSWERKYSATGGVRPIANQPVEVITADPYPTFHAEPGVWTLEPAP